MKKQLEIWVVAEDPFDDGWMIHDRNDTSIGAVAYFCRSKRWADELAKRLAKLQKMQAKKTKFA